MAADMAASLSGMGQNDVAMALDAPPANETAAVVDDARSNPDGQAFGGPSLEVPATADKAGQLEGTNWRYSDFLEAVDSGKVERVRFSKDGSQLQLTAVDGRRALVTLPNDPELVDLLAKNGVDIPVSEGESQGNYVAFIGNLFFSLIACGGLFFLVRRAQGGGGPTGCGPMEFGKSKSKFQEVPETGVFFDDVAGMEGAKI